MSVSSGDKMKTIEYIEQNRFNIEKKSLWNKAFILILSVNFCHQICQQMMNTLVPKYAASFGSEAYLVGLVSSAFAMASFLIRPVASPAFDSYSKKKLLIFTLIGLLTTFFGYSISNGIKMVLCFRFLHGACMGCISPLSLSMASDSLPDDKLGKGIGIFTLCQAVGQAVGPGIGLTLSDQIGYKKTFLFAVVVIGIAIILSFLIKDTYQENGVYRITLKKIIEPSSIPVATIQMFLTMSYMCIGSYLAIYSDIIGVDNIGLYFTVYAVALFVTRPLSGILLDKYGFKKVLIPGMICFSISFLIISFSTSLTGFLFAAIVNAAGYGICYPTMQAMVMSSAAKENRGSAASTSFIGADLGTFIGPALMGLIIDRITINTGFNIQGYKWGFRAMMVPVLSGLVFFLVSWSTIYKNIQQHTVSSSEV